MNNKCHVNMIQGIPGLRGEDGEPGFEGAPVSLPLMIVVSIIIRFLIAVCDN